jgi:hypothetical protein
VSASIPLERYEYEIGEGVFGHALKDNRNRFRGLEFQRLYLEVQDEGKQCATWLKYSDFGINLADFSFDLSEDLLVLVEDPHDGLDMHTKYVYCPSFPFQPLTRRSEYRRKFAYLHFPRMHHILSRGK